MHVFIYTQSKIIKQEKSLDENHKNDHGGETYCKSCHGNDEWLGAMHKAQLETCCTKACNCDDLVGGVVGIIIGIIIGLVGLLLVLIFMCGIVPCCCFAKEAGAAQVAVAQPGVQMVQQQAYVQPGVAQAMPVQAVPAQAAVVQPAVVQPVQ